MELLQGWEHREIAVLSPETVTRPSISFSGRDDAYCYELKQRGDGSYLQTGYYVGTDWLRPGERAVQIRPKLDTAGRSLDHLAMLFTCLRHPQVTPFIEGLYQVDFELPFISLPRQDDLLTPILVGHFLNLLRDVVRQGVKKGYNPVARELHGRIKGKIDVASTLRRGVFRQRPLLVACSFEEFSVDIPENRLLKQALRFARYYLHTVPAYSRDLEPLLSYCEPAFASVTDDEASSRMVHGNSNPLYRAYDQALRVGKLLLQRFGYSLRQINPDQQARVSVPPHWIDMSRLFELFVLSKMYDTPEWQTVLYGWEQAGGNYGLPDYLLPGNKPLIIDAKYRPAYQRDEYFIEDIRQISGYARDRGVLTRLGLTDSQQQDSALIDCLIIYPAHLESDGLLAPDERPVSEIPPPEQLTKHRVDQFTRFYKLPLLLPVAFSKG